ncbi:hypothetical protein [uncultured Imperialibacter sp.]|uniref:hypothetical protein n=1 Tax=uncultured Imperialibacter sp. TaxID=1672639 RepID=UPI0030DC6028|tara:strand:- start:1685 stop:2200 length:516 start_codon:yes stop_codon:yes gene_type:complete
MEGLKWLEYIKDRRPEYPEIRMKIIDRFAQKGDKSRIGDYVQFGPIYQLYMYAFMLGFHKKERIPLPTEKKMRKEFYPLGDWKPSGMVSYILMLLLSSPHVIREADIDFGLMEDMPNEEAEKRFDKLIIILEEHANAGLSILEEFFEKDPYFFNDPFAFAILLKDITEGKA